jgi:DNA-binding MarR family transcriptional regulator
LILDNIQQSFIDENGQYHIRWTLLDIVHSAIARTRDIEIAKVGLTTQQAKALWTIHMYGGKVTEGELAAATFRQHHSTYTLINRMIKLKLIKRVKSPKENFARFAMTEKGKNIFSQVTRTSTEYIFSGLTPEELQQMDAILLKLDKRANAYLGIDRDEMIQTFFVKPDTSFKGLPKNP